MDVTGISVRKDELDAVVKVLETDFETADKAARAVLTTAMKVLLQRDWWLVIAADLGLAYGFYATESGAIKAVYENHLGIVDQARVLHVNSATGRTEYVRIQP